MKGLLLILPLLFLAACEPAEPTAAQVAERLQAQINELLEELDTNLKEFADLDLYANSGRMTAGIHLIILRYRAFALLI